MINVLITNDDGIFSKGIGILSETLGKQGYNVWVVAPDRERSAVSHTITLRDPLRINEIAKQTFAVSGTPADCAYMGMFYVMPEIPDIVISGINNGYNLGNDIFYSGTIAGAFEAALRGISSISASSDRGSTENQLKDFSEKIGNIIPSVCEKSGKSILYNMNYPPVEECKGYMFTSVGHRNYSNVVDIRKDPKGAEYFWIGGPVSKGYENLQGGERSALDSGCISISPIDPFIYSKDDSSMYNMIKSDDLSALKAMFND
ncbi:MAG: 5'/3'-nucleotidase SurE [Deltaproteobacteria bacterium]|nr:5'/3'-nucleotidase SurE [Deltaproteobacteria bacterium]